MITTNIATTTTYFVGNYYEVANGVITKYYYAGSQRIATLAPGASAGVRSSGTFYFMVSTGSTRRLKDQLGSASVVTDSSGTTVGEQRREAYPFGETRLTTGTIYTDKLFTGQRDTGLGIYDYKARYYSRSYRYIE